MEAHHIIIWFGLVDVLYKCTAISILTTYPPLRDCVRRVQQTTPLQNMPLLNDASGTWLRLLGWATGHTLPLGDYCQGPIFGGLRKMNKDSGEYCSQVLRWLQSTTKAKNSDEIQYVTFGLSYAVLTASMSC